MHAPKLFNSFEGGYVATNNTQLADRLDRMKFWGLACDVDRGGRALDASLNEMHAAMALASLDGVEEQIHLHRRKYELYAEGLRRSGRPGPRRARAGAASRLSAHRRQDFRNRWPFSRDETLRRLQAENALARPYYYSLAEKRVEYERICPNLPVTAAIASTLMVLPSGAHVSDRDVEKIIELLIAIRRIAQEPSSPRKSV